MAKKPQAHAPRFPKTAQLFEALDRVKATVMPLHESIQQLLTRYEGTVPLGFEYTAPPPQAGNAWTLDPIKEGRARLVDTEEAPAPEPAHHRWKIGWWWARDLDAFHVSFQRFSEALKNAQTLVDDAAEELDGPGAPIDQRPSVRLLMAIKELVAAVPYDPKLEHREDLPPVELVWCENLLSRWRAVGEWLWTCRCVSKMRRITAKGPESISRGENPSRSKEAKRAKVSARGSSTQPPTSSAQGSPKSHGSSFVFQSFRENWKIVYEGTSFVLERRTGFVHLHHLLGNPRRSISARELHQQGKPVVESSSSDAVLDDRAEAGLWTRRSRILEELRSASSDLDPDVRKKAEEEIKNIDEQLKKAITPSGASKPLGKSDVSAVAVTQAIDRAYENLRKSGLNELCQFFERHIRRDDGCWQYLPPDPEPDWEL